MTDRSPGFLTADTPKPKRVAMSVLGQDSLSAKTGRSKPLPAAEVRRGAELSRHARCVEHVDVEGLREPVCIGKRDDRDRVIAAARELAGS